MKRPLFIAIDGEELEQDYALLMARTAISGMSAIRSSTQLDTTECLSFVLELREKFPKAILVCFGLGYDANQWLSSLSQTKLHQLWTTGRLRVGGWRLAYRARKWLDVSYGEHSARVYDVQGFFQTSFVKACAQWGVELPEMVGAMKEARGSFTREMFSDVADYCATECETLVQLMDKLAVALRDAELWPRGWHGAGAIASRLLAKHAGEMFPHMPAVNIERAARAAYYGGRIEVLRYGHTERPVYQHDIRSAYPAAAARMPCWSCGTWERRRAPVVPWGLYNVSWQRSILETAHPLPWRAKGGRVYFPREGSGWYWGVELLGLPPHEYILRDGWHYTPAECGHDWSWISRYYTRRQAPDCSPGESKAIKLGLNALYGKLAQRMGYGDLRPKYHSILAAGFITAQSRASLWRAYQLAPAAVLAFSTDSVLASCELPLPIGNELGMWDLAEYPNATLVQSGLYWFGDKLAKSRGLEMGTLTREQVLRGWEAGESHADVTTRRFVGMGLALSQDWKLWRTWQTQPRAIALHPFGGKRTSAHDANKPRVALVQTRPAARPHGGDSTGLDWSSLDNEARRAETECE